VIDKVKDSIESHRASKDIEPKSLEAEIIRNADAMSHLDILPVLFKYRSEKEKDFAKVFQWVYDKVEQDWNKKITLKEARFMAKEKYDAIKTILGAMKKYL